MRRVAPFSILLLAGCGLPSLPSIAISTHVGGSQIKGSGGLVTKARTAKNVRRIVVAGGIELDVRPGDAAVKIEAQSNIQPLIHTKYENGTLVIESKGSYSTDKGVRAIVTMPSVTDLSVSGGSSAKAQGFKAATLNLDSSGGAEIDWKGNATTLLAEASGGSTIRLRGSAHTAKIEASGAGAVDIDRLEGGDLTLDLSGAALSTIPGRAKTLRIEASGASQANLGTLASDKAYVTAEGASSIKIGRTNGGSAQADGASTIEYRGRLDHTQSGTASSIVGK